MPGFGVQKCHIGRKVFWASAALSIALFYKSFIGTPDFSKSALRPNAGVAAAFKSEKPLDGEMAEKGAGCITANAARAGSASSAGAEAATVDFEKMPRILIFREMHQRAEHRDFISENMGWFGKLGYKKIFLELLDPKVQPEINSYLKYGRMPGSLKSALYCAATLYGREDYATEDDNSYLRLFSAARAQKLEIKAMHYPVRFACSDSSYVELTDRHYANAIRKASGGKKSMVLVGNMHFLLAHRLGATDILLRSGTEADVQSHSDYRAYVGVVEDAIPKLMGGAGNGLWKISLREMAAPDYVLKFPCQISDKIRQ